MSVSTEARTRRPATPPLRTISILATCPASLARDPDGDWYAGQLATLDLPALAAAASTDASADRYQYVLSVHADDGSTHRLELGEAGLPDALRPLVTLLELRARAH